MINRKSIAQLSTVKKKKKNTYNKGAFRQKMYLNYEYAHSKMKVALIESQVYTHKNSIITLTQIKTNVKYKGMNIGSEFSWKKSS